MKQWKKGKIDWSQFLSGVPAGDYMFQDIPYEEQVEHASALIKEADMILIGAGAGASAAAGLTYSGERFTSNFGEFIEKYGLMYMTDMYAAGFYPFPTQEAKWGYWSKHSVINRFLPPAMPLYHQLYEIVKEKDYFVLTTNVDHQFQKASLQRREIMVIFNVKRDVIRRFTMQRIYSGRWIRRDRTVWCLLIWYPDVRSAAVI